MRMRYRAAVAALIFASVCRAEDTSSELEGVLGDYHEHDGTVFNTTHNVNENVATAVTNPSAEPDLVRMISYNPLSQVTDHAALDLDQKAMVEILRSRGAGRQQLLVEARQIYQKGGHSGSYALLSVTVTGPLNIPVLTQVVGTAADGSTPIRGFIPRDLVCSGKEGTIQIPVEYDLQ
jgi:hypothetical protein